MKNKEDILDKIDEILDEVNNVAKNSKFYVGDPGKVKPQGYNYNQSKSFGDFTKIDPKIAASVGLGAVTGAGIAYGLSKTSAGKHPIDWSRRFLKFLEFQLGTEKGRVLFKRIGKRLKKEAALLMLCILAAWYSKNLEHSKNGTKPRKILLGLGITDALITAIPRIYNTVSDEVARFLLELKPDELIYWVGPIYILDTFTPFKISAKLFKELNDLRRFREIDVDNDVYKKIYGETPEEYKARKNKSINKTVDKEEDEDLFGNRKSGLDKRWGREFPD